MGEKKEDLTEPDNEPQQQRQQQPRSRSIGRSRAMRTWRERRRLST